MKLSYLSTIIGFSMALSANAKTWILDDFLKYQDTSHIHFDTEKSIPGVSAYESQFMIDDELTECDESFYFESDRHYNADEAYSFIKKCKGENFNAFEARRHEAEFRDAYAEKFYNYINKIKKQLNEITEIKVNNIITRFDIESYDMDTELYSTKPVYAGYPSYNIFVDNRNRFFKFPLSNENHLYPLETRYGCTLDPIFQFKIPRDIAEKIYTEDGAIIFSVTADVKMGHFSDYKVKKGALESVNRNSQGMSCKLKEVNVELVEKNEIYNTKVLSVPYTNYISDFYKLMEYMYAGTERNREAIVGVINDKNVIYSTKEVSWE